MTHPRQRGERGHAEGTFLRKLTMVCLVVLVVSGLVAYWIGETTTSPQRADRPPFVGQSNARHVKTRDQRQLTRPVEGGVDCDDRA